MTVKLRRPNGPQQLAKGIAIAFQRDLGLTPEEREQPIRGRPDTETDEGVGYTLQNVRLNICPPSLRDVLTEPSQV